MELKNLKALNQVSTLHLVEYFFVKEMEKFICYYFQIFGNNMFKSLNILGNKRTFRVNL